MAGHTSPSEVSFYLHESILTYIKHERRKIKGDDRLSNQSTCFLVLCPRLQFTQIVRINYLIVLENMPSEARILGMERMTVFLSVLT